VTPAFPASRPPSTTDLTPTHHHLSRKLSKLLFIPITSTIVIDINFLEIAERGKKLVYLSIIAQLSNHTRTAIRLSRPTRNILTDTARCLHRGIFLRERQATDLD
jgi:hypothetical protein